MKFFKPILAGAHRKDRLVAYIGAGLGIILTVTVCASIPHEIADLPIIVAPLLHEVNLSTIGVNCIDLRTRYCTRHDGNEPQA